MAELAAKTGPKSQERVTAKPVGSNSRGSQIGHIVAYIVLLLGALAFLFPFYYMVIGSVSPSDEVGKIIPTSLELANWRYMVSRIPIGRNLLNSGIYAGGVILTTLIVGSLTGYALARLTFYGRDFVFNIILL